MFEALEKMVENLQVPPDADSIQQLIAIKSRLDAHLAEALAGFDRNDLWDLDGATSLMGWLKASGLSRRDAARATNVTRRLSELPAMAAAWRDGALSAGQVDVVLSTVTEATLALLVEDEAGLAARLAGASMEDTARIMRNWQSDALERAGDDRPPRRDEPERSLWLSQTFGGTWALDATLDAESGQALATALRIAQTRDLPGDPIRVAAERRADALADVIKFFLDQHTAPKRTRNRPHLGVLIDVEAAEAGGAGAFIDGSALDGSAVQALLCDSALSRVLRAGKSTILDYGRATRTIPPGLWNALVTRDEHCRMPGCDRPWWWCDGHHVLFWEQDGDTALWNLVLLCRRHHRLLHRGGWEAKILPDGTFEVTDPDGSVRTSRPPGALAA